MADPAAVDAVVVGAGAGGAAAAWRMTQRGWRVLLIDAGPAFDPDYAGVLNEWKDTVMLKQDLRVAVRTRYERFTGDFVTHCHIMFHGDHGMMLNLRIYGPKQPEAASATHH